MSDRASVRDLLHFSVGTCVTSYTGQWIRAVFLAEFFPGCCGLMLLNGRETVRNMCIHVYSNTSRHLPSGLTFTSPMCRLCSNIYNCVFKILRQTLLWNNLRWKYLQNNCINEGEKSKTSFEAFLSVCDHYFYPNK